VNEIPHSFKSNHSFEYTNSRHKHDPSFLCNNSTKMLSKQRNLVRLEATFCKLSYPTEYSPWSSWLLTSERETFCFHRTRRFITVFISRHWAFADVSDVPVAILSLVTERYRQHDHSWHRHISTSLYQVTYQKTAIYVVTAIFSDFLKINPTFTWEGKWRKK